MKHSHLIQFLLLSYSLTFIACKKNAQVANTSKEVYNWQTFAMGADLSFVNAVEVYGGKYRLNGEQKDVYELLKAEGTNTVRVRLWHNPAWQRAVSSFITFNDLNDVTKTIERAKKAGMAVNLVLHYSDTWADPANQSTPAAWWGVPLSTLQDSVYNYTRFVLQTLAFKNLTPEMIQIGNETNNGMCWPVGQISSNGWLPYTTLVKAGIKAIRDFSVTSTIKPKIILHHAQLQTAGSWAKSLLQSGVSDFDIFGVSHYYKWSSVNTMDAVKDSIAGLKAITGKQVMIVETAFPFTNANADGYDNIFYEPSGNIAGYPLSPEGQLNYFKDLTNAVWKGGGSGVMVWEPAWITSTLRDGWGMGSSWENNSFFDFNGNLHKGVQFMTARYPF